MVWGWWGPGIQGLTSWSSCEIWICCGHWAHSPDPGLPGCGWRGILGPGAEHRHLLLQVLSDFSLSASFLGQGGRLGQRGLFHLALGLRPQAGSLPGSQMVMKAHEGSPRGLWPPFLAPGGGELSLAFLDTRTAGPSPRPWSGRRQDVGRVLAVVRRGLGEGPAARGEGLVASEDRRAGACHPRAGITLITQVSRLLSPALPGHRVLLLSLSPALTPVAGTWPL